MDDLDRFIKAMDLHQPDWFGRFCTEQDSRDMAYAAREKDYPKLERLLESRRQTIAQDLMMPVRAAIEAGLVEIKS